MPKWALTATSRTGKKINPLSGSSNTVTVYSQADLDHRIEAAKTDPHPEPLPKRTPGGSL